MNKFNNILVLSIFTLIFIGSITLVYADYDSPRKQLKSGILPEDVICREGKVLVIRDNRNPACVTESTADKKGWEIIKHIKNEVSPVQLNELPGEQQQKTFVDYGTATASFSNNATLAKINNFCSDWPKNFSVQFPNAVLIGEDFDIHIHYANIIYDDEDILESKQTGETLSPQDAEDKLENARDSCFDTFAYFGLNEKISLITPHVIDKPTLNADTQRTTNYYHIEYPFNNTEEQVQIVTMRFDSLPDRYDGNMLIGTQGPKIKINHFVDDNGIIFLDTPSTNNVNVAFSAVSPFAAMTDEQKTSSNFYTQEILLPEKALCEQFACDENGVPVGNTEETLPPMEIFAEYIKANVAPEDVIFWLQNEEKLTPEYVEELLETYFPDLVAQFILFF